MNLLTTTLLTLSTLLGTTHGYDCSQPEYNVAVCGNGVWQLAADCGTGFCVWPAGYTTPFCAAHSDYAISA
ncbi:hypothetical protein BDW74DRAFT_176047 [Aspergillus multicolor]|uniref:uncharacterized protein n=1 Tax=Aspergillus multicolor TaxID=41759 RepID=UPI003CCDE1CD